MVALMPTSLLSCVGQHQLSHRWAEPALLIKKSTDQHPVHATRIVRCLTDILSDHHAKICSCV